MKKILFFFLFGFITIFSMAQSSVSGVVKSQDGEALPGVNVIIKGTTSGTITGIDGDFNISIKKFPVTLQFSFIGFDQKLVDVKTATSDLQVTLESDVQSLNEVVVVGYGTVRRSDLTGSVASIQAADIDDKVLTSVSQGLQGLAAGVEVVTASGEPGGGIEVKIRGANSLLGSNNPLYVIDGIPLTSGVQATSGDYMTGTNPLSNLNPNDIQNIEVLKDASATAIYGSRGSNGVILITTKQAAGGRPRLEYTTRLTVSVPGTPIEMMNGIEFATWQNYEAMLRRPGKTEQELIDSGDLPFRGQDDVHLHPSNAYVGTDFMDEILRNTFSQEHGLNYSFSNEKVKNYLSFDFSDQKGIIKESQFTRLNTKFSNEYKVSELLEFRTNLNVSYVRNNRVQTAAKSGLHGVNFLAMKINPMVPLYDVDGNYYAWTSGGDIASNPMVELTETDNVLENKDVYGGIHGIFHVTPELDINARVNGTFRKSENKAFWSGNTVMAYKDNGKANINSATQGLIVTDIFAQYQKKLNRHYLNVMAGVSAEYTSVFRNGAVVSDFQFYDLGYDNLSMANVRNSTTSSKYTTSLQSGFARVNYNFAEKYLLTLTARADGASVFGENNKWGFFPSVALAWRAGNEEFIKNLGVFSSLKVRASVGSVGNWAISPYQTLATFGIGSASSIDQTNTVTTYSERVANPDLKWETTQSVNLGMDLGFFDNRLTITPEVYYKKTEDLLLQRLIPRATGYGVITSNLGTLENKGFELSLMGYIIQNQKFKWSTRLNISHNKGKVLELPGMEYLEGGKLMVNALNQTAHRVYPDMEMGLIYGYIADGIIQMDDVEIVTNAQGNQEYQVKTDADGNPAFIPVNNDRYPGHLKYRDIAGGGENGDEPDGKINSDDRTFIGNTNPDFTFGFSNDFYFGPFSLSLFFNGSVGNDIVNVSKVLFQNGMYNNNQTSEWYDERWTMENQHNDLNWAAGGQSLVSTSCVEDGSYIRLKSVTLGYDIPVSKSKLFSKARVYFTGTNLLTITGYHGFDPEVSTSAAGGSQIGTPGVDAAAYPRAKAFSMGLNLTF